MIAQSRAPVKVSIGDVLAQKQMLAFTGIGREPASEFGAKRKRTARRGWRKIKKKGILL